MIGSEGGIHRRPSAKPGRIYASAALGTPRIRRVVVIAAIVTAVIPTAIWGRTHATFNAITSTGNNSLAGGTVTFGPNSPATALFTVGGAVPGDSGTACVKITYTGTVDAAAVRLYIAPGGLTGSGLASYLNVQINEGTGNNASCSDFVKSATAYNSTGLSDFTKTLAAFAGSSTNFSTGVSTWTAVPAGANRTYQVAYFLQPDNAAQSRTASFVLTWEAQ